MHRVNGHARRRFNPARTRAHTRAHAHSLAQYIRTHARPHAHRYARAHAHIFRFKDTRMCIVVFAAILHSALFPFFSSALGQTRLCMPTGELPFLLPGELPSFLLGKCPSFSRGNSPAFCQGNFLPFYQGNSPTPFLLLLHVPLDSNNLTE